MATATLLHRKEAVRDLESRLLRALTIARLGGEKLVTHDGRFEVKRMLGRGASGVVCEALDHKLIRPVALKLYPGLADDHLAGAVRAEARSLASLSHHNIVIVWDYDAAELRPGDLRCFYVAMELLPGSSLRHWLAQAPTPEAVMDVFCRAGDGLAAAHAAGLVHRDFKPENVMLVGDVPKIVDFGLAIEAPAPVIELVSSDPQQRAIVGTLAYMAPEALRGKADARSDQFSFAAAIWEGLCGEFPYRIDSVDPNERGRLRAPNPRVPLVPAVFERLTRALNADPARRYPGIRELVAGLRQLQGGLRPASPTVSVPRLTLADSASFEATPGLGVSSVIASTGIQAPPSKRSWLPWLAFPAVAAGSVSGVLLAAGFWTEEGAEAPASEVLAAEIDALPVAAPPPTVDAAQARCTAAAALAGEWTFDTAAQWSSNQSLVGLVGHYALAVSFEARDCQLDLTLQKAGNDSIVYSAPHVDRRRASLELAPPFTGRSSAEFAPKKSGEAAPIVYNFEFVFDGDRLLGSFQGRLADKRDFFKGVLAGGRRGAQPAALSDAQPCVALCGARCFGPEAAATCRQGCAEPWQRPDCPPPDADATTPLPVNKASAGCQATANQLAGTWRFLLRDRKHPESTRDYEFGLRAEGCRLRVRNARVLDGGTLPNLSGSGQVYAHGSWELTLTGDDVEHRWSLVGADPAFGSFKAVKPGKKVRPLASGPLAAYRQP